MALILCIETGTDVCSVALARDGRLVSLQEGQGRDHARRVAVMTEELLEAAGLKPSDLDAVAVGKGPGSYTGLRIGVSFAKGLCYSLGIPLIAIDSLESLARIAVEDHVAGILKTDDWDEVLLCPMIDARRMEVYTEIFDSSLNRLSGVSAEIIDENSFGEYVAAGRRFLIFGSGAEKCAEVLPAVAFRFVEVVPSARGLCSAAQQKFDEGQTEDVAYFEPYYLKDFVVTTSKKKLF